MPACGTWLHLNKLLLAANKDEQQPQQQQLHRTRKKKHTSNKIHDENIYLTYGLSSVCFTGALRIPLSMYSLPHYIQYNMSMITCDHTWNSWIVILTTQLRTAHTYVAFQYGFVNELAMRWRRRPREPFVRSLSLWSIATLFDIK